MTDNTSDNSGKKKIERKVFALDPVSFIASQTDEVELTKEEKQSISDKNGYLGVILDELKKMKEEVPVSLKVVEQKEYAKNSISTDLTEVYEDYLGYLDLKIERSNKKKAEQALKSMQSGIVVSVNLIKARVSYLEGSKDVILVIKEIKTGNGSIEGFIEIIPSELANEGDKITFLNEINEGKIS